MNSSFITSKPGHTHLRFAWTPLDFIFNHLGHRHWYSRYSIVRAIVSSKDHSYPSETMENSTLSELKARSANVSLIFVVVVILVATAKTTHALILLSTMTDLEVIK